MSRGKAICDYLSPPKQLNGLNLFYGKIFLITFSLDFCIKAAEQIELIS